MKHLFLNLLAFGSLISSVLVITSKNPVLAVIFLIAVFVNAAGYLILLGIGFIGISYIIIYIGAITVLFLFVIMMINIKLTDILETGSQYTKNLPLALGIGSLFIYEFFTIIPFSFNDVSIISFLLNLISNLNGLLLNSDLSITNTVYNTINPVTADTTFTNFLQIQAIGQSLYTFGSSWLIITSLILLLAMIAPIFISKNPQTQSTPTSAKLTQKMLPMQRLALFSSNLIFLINSPSENNTVQNTISDLNNLHYLILILSLILIISFILIKIIKTLIVKYVPVKFVKVHKLVQNLSLNKIELEIGINLFLFFITYIITLLMIYSY